MVKRNPEYHERDMKDEMTLRQQLSLSTIKKVRGIFRKGVSDVINEGLPGFSELEPERLELLSFLEEIHEKTGKPPIVLIEHESKGKACFTNPSMREVLEKITGSPSALKKYVRVITLSSKQRNFPRIEDNVIYILGGSQNDVFDSFGMPYTRKFSIPLLEKVEQGRNLCAVAICFGHQSLMNAYGTLTDQNIQTWGLRKPEFHFLPVRFLSGKHPGLIHLEGDQPRGVMITRSGYPLLPDQNLDEIKGLEPVIVRDKAGSSPYPRLERTAFIPLGVTLYDGAILSTQLHPELEPGYVRSFEPVVKFCRENLERTYPSFIASLGLREYEDLERRLPIRGVAAAFFIPTLKSFAESVFKRL